VNPFEFLWTLSLGETVSSSSEDDSVYPEAEEEDEFRLLRLEDEGVRPVMRALFPMGRLI